MRYLFLCRDFSKNNLPLQPWRYIHEMATFLSSRHSVNLLSDLDNRGDKHLFNYKLHYVNAIKPVNTKKLASAIRNINPDIIIWSTVTPATISYISLYKKLSVPVYALINYPLYTLSEILRAQKALSFFTLKQFYRYSLIPNFF